MKRKMRRQKKWVEFILPSFFFFFDSGYSFNLCVLWFNIPSFFFVFDLGFNLFDRALVVYCKWDISILQYVVIVVVVVVVVFVWRNLGQMKTNMERKMNNMGQMRTNLEGRRRIWKVEEEISDAQHRNIWKRIWK